MQHRAEDFLLQLIKAFEFDQRGRHEGAMGAFFLVDTGQLMHASAFVAHGLQVAFDGVARFTIDDRAYIQ